MVRKRKRSEKRSAQGKAKRAEPKKRAAKKKSIEEQVTEDIAAFGVDEWTEEPLDIYEAEPATEIMTVGDVRELIESEQYDLINPYEEVGECVLCGRPVRYIDIANSEYPDDTPIDEATDVLCRFCRGEVSDWDEYLEEAY
ncbi:MAG: hypothetical protein RMK18_11460 [Armatimonadota bacterium]|nr:hypothetical protein [Armatimonadota bacterium]MDW8026466.1 hypothetical protein [Armatimonadota bacterium]